MSTRIRRGTAFIVHRWPLGGIPGPWEVWSNGDVAASTTPGPTEMKGAPGPEKSTTLGAARLHRWTWPLAVAVPLVAMLPALASFHGTSLLAPSAWLLGAAIAVNLVAGVGPGLLAAVLSPTLLWFSFTDPRWSFRIGDDAERSGILTVFALALALTAALQALRRARAHAGSELTQLDALLGHAPIGVAFLDRELQFVKVNDAFADVDGVAVGDHLGRPLTDVLDLPDAFALAERVRDTGVAALDVVARVQAGGYTRHLSVGYYPVRDAVGDVVGVGVVARDITTQAEAEAGRVALLERLQRLQRITASLAAAQSLDEVIRVVVVDIRRAVGATAASLVGVDGDELIVLGADGYDPGVTARWGRFPVSDSTPLGAVVTTGSIIHVSTLGELRSSWPAIAPSVPADANERAATAIPLIDHGRVTGAVGLTFDRSREYDASEEAFLVAMASQCAQALVRARLYESEREARQTSDAAAAGLAFLAEANAQLATTFDAETSANRVIQLVVPRLGDWCAVHLLGVGGAATRESSVAVRSGREPAHVLPMAAEELVRLTAKARVPLLDGLPLDPTGDGLGTFLSVPLVAQDRVMGVLCVAVEGARRLRPDDVALATQLANHVAQAVVNANLFAERAHIARTLQASLLPPATPTIPGVEVATRFHAVGEGIVVGGDFYDVFRLGRPGNPSDRWAVVIGDVRGKGAEAAAITGAARHAIRSAGLRHVDPSQMLHELNEVLLVMAADIGDDDPRFCTAVVASVAAGDDRASVRMAIGGHPQPVLLRADGTTSSVGTPGNLLGVLPDPDLTDVDIELGPGDALVLFTDGITERHNGTRFLDEEGLAAIVSRCAGFTAAALAERVETAARAFVEEAPRDDMAVLVVRVPERRAVTASVTAELPSDPSAAGLARHFVEAALSATVDERALETAMLLSSELVTNAVVHGTGPVRISLDLPDGRVRVSVTDGSSEPPRLVRSEPESSSGRGIYLVELLATAWGIEGAPAGKTVWFELDTL